MRFRLLLDRLLILILAVTAWQVCSFVFGAQWFSTPWVTSDRFIASLLDGDIFRHAQFTLAEAAAGFLVGGLPGVLLPFALRRSPALAAVLDPYLIGGYGVPKLAVAPLFILWFGIGLGSKIALVASIVFFLMYFNAAAGVKAVSVQLLHMARVAGASEADIARHIVWPCAAPYILAGIRISAPYAIGAAVVGELISANRGLGYLIQAAAMDFNVSGVFVALIGLTILVIGINWIFDRTERWLLRWRPAEATRVRRLRAAA
jgi:NitT/TauT family transport system permease protein